VSGGSWRGEKNNYEQSGKNRLANVRMASRSRKEKKNGQREKKKSVPGPFGRKQGKLNLMEENQARYLFLGKGFGEGMGEGGGSRKTWEEFLWQKNVAWPRVILLGAVEEAIEAHGQLKKKCGVGFYFDPVDGAHEKNLHANRW